MRRKTSYASQNRLKGAETIVNMESVRAFAKDVGALKTYVLLSAALFFAGAGFGYGSEAFGTFLAGQLEPLRQIAERMNATENAQLWFFLFIFFNNFVKSLLVVFLGALFGVFPIYFLVMNGMILGYVAAATGRAGGDVGQMLITGILPHGVFELTAIIIACAYGLKYGVLIAVELGRAIRGREATSAIRAFHGTLKRLIAFLFFTLLAAAFIESTITYLLVRG